MADLSKDMTVEEALQALKFFRDHGRTCLSASEAAAILGCQSASLTHAANKKGTLGSLDYYWAGSVLKISVMSLIHFVSGGYPLRDIFSEVGA
jgi:hypothetical protein